MVTSHHQGNEMARWAARPCSGLATNSWPLKGVKGGGLGVVCTEPAGGISVVV
jgi:hypothetical protein